MRGTYELKRSGEQFMFDLKAANAQVILTGERYVTKGGAFDGTESVRKNSPLDLRYERRRTTTNLPYFVLPVPNGEAPGCCKTYSATTATETGTASAEAIVRGRITHAVLALRPCARLP